jgi:hypothetical protein
MLVIGHPKVDKLIFARGDVGNNEDCAYKGLHYECCGFYAIEVNLRCL